MRNEPRIAPGSVWCDTEAQTWSPWCTVVVTEIDLLGTIRVRPQHDPTHRFTGVTKTFSRSQFRQQFRSMNEETQ